MNKSLWFRVKNFLSYLSIPYANAAYLIKARLNKSSLNKSFEPHEIDDNFFGINVAPNADSQMDDYFIARLKELGLRSVRTDYTYDSNKENFKRWIDRLVSEKFEVIIHFVQPTSSSSNMHKPHVVQKWKDFIEPVIKKYHKNVQLYEIGSTPNRQSWSGYTIKDYIATVKSAKEITDKYGVKILGPNTSDYAPYFLITILHKLNKLGINFSMVSDNLFVDRADQPESYDKHVAGNLLKNILKMNLANKCQSINNIAKIYGSDSPICTFFNWRIDNNEIKRRHAVSENKYCDYIIRYYLIAAAGNLLKRVYFGPIASNEKGLIDDTVETKYYPPLVYLKRENLLSPAHYRIRPAYYSYLFLIRMLKNSRFKCIIPTPESTFIYKFERDNKPFFTAWTLDGMADSLLKYPEIKFDDYNIFNRDGKKTDSPKITENPIYLVTK
ncbi:MAG: hypothetical protein GY864_06760 [Desulfobacterales bacterium]|nr:hypothetical protein [Desulfobacterales bacterium]